MNKVKKIRMISMMASQLPSESCRQLLLHPVFLPRYEAEG